MPSSPQMIRKELRELARQGRLVEECFQVFQREFFPTASPVVAHAMRMCFFAGAAELWALINAGIDEADDISDAEEEFMGQWVAEVEAFHERNIANLMNQSTSH